MIQSTLHAVQAAALSLDPTTLAGLALGLLVVLFAGIVTHHVLCVNEMERKRLARDYWGMRHDAKGDMER